jgi:AcrR family transcriptional regulator
MTVSAIPASLPLDEQGPRGRMARLMLETAVTLMQAGRVPSVSEVAESAGVSRATAYRHFPSRAALVEAVVDQALGPILQWRSDSNDAFERIEDLFATAFPRLEAFEATFRAALMLSLEEWTKDRDGQERSEPTFRRGHRIALLREALAPMLKDMPEEDGQRLLMSLSLIFGIETFIVLKDMWGADRARLAEVAVWAAHALMRAARPMRHGMREPIWSDQKGGQGNP